MFLLSVPENYHWFYKFICTVIIYYLLTWGYPFGLYWALFPRFVSDLNRSKVRSKELGVTELHTVVTPGSKFDRHTGGSGAHPLIPGEAPFGALSPDPIDNYIGYY